MQVLTVKYPSEVCWRNTHVNDSGSSGGAGQEGQGRRGGQGGKAGHDGGGTGDGEGCDAEVIVCATNRLSGPGDNARVNFTFEVRLGETFVREGGGGGLLPTASLPPSFWGALLSFGIACTPGDETRPEVGLVHEVKKPTDKF